MNVRDNRHTPVLLREVIDGLALRSEAIVIDATLGSGGHFFAIRENLGPDGFLLGVDVDKVAVEEMRPRLPKAGAGGPKAILATGNFRNIRDIAAEHGVMSADAILADLGWRSEHLASGRGFSFTAEEPLLMTLGEPKEYRFTAADIVNGWREEDIANVLRAYGEERRARQIAGAICRARERRPIATARELGEIVASALPDMRRRGRIHPATKTFQALRIAVNDELQALRDFISAAVLLLAPAGRLAIISFHSSEDRIVKQAYRQGEADGALRRITKKPIIPSTEEVTNNPRAQSAKLRIAEKI